MNRSLRASIDIGFTREKHLLKNLIQEFQIVSHKITQWQSCFHMHATLMNRNRTKENRKKER